MAELLSEISDLTTRFLELKKEIEKIEEQTIKPLQAQITEIQGKLIRAFEANKLTKFAGTDGSVHLIIEKKIKMPQGDDKIKFIDFLKNRGEWDVFASIHHATLNSWFNENMVQDPLFVAPGLGLPSENKYLKRGK